jgi:hypothetical protein
MTVQPGFSELHLSAQQLQKYARTQNKSTTRSGKNMLGSMWTRSVRDVQSDMRKLCATGSEDRIVLCIRGRWTGEEIFRGCRWSWHD